ncbi:MAG: ABC transporter permease subunit [Halioglobus sp.]
MTRLAEHIPSYSPPWRRFKDRLATTAITAGGAGVLLAILLIFFYLLYEVLPLFDNAKIEKHSEYHWSGSTKSPLYLAMEEQGELGFAVDRQGEGHFFEVDSGVLRQSVALGGKDLSVVAPESPDSTLLALGYRDGQVRLIQHEYRMTYPGGSRLITPSIERLYPAQAFDMGTGSVEVLAVNDSEDALLVAAEMSDGQGVVHRYNKDVDFLTEEIVLQLEILRIPSLPGTTEALYIGSGQRWLYRLDSAGGYSVIDLQKTDGEGALSIAQQGALFEDGGSLASHEMLLGGISLLVASDRGELSQFFMVRTDQGETFERIRSFKTEGVSLDSLLPEHRRKGFLGLNAQGELFIFHSTANRTLLREAVLPGGGTTLAALSPRGNKLLLMNAEGAVQTWIIENEHPDISWSALWQKVWYESYEEPAYVWQSSASNNDFEPKYSFSPLAFGTLKAAFYTMLIAAPLGICGAIYTAYFMAAGLRRKVKPLIELMEALPTVILGFLAGLWLAPFVENYLTGVFTVLLVVPVGILVFAFAWSRLPISWSSWVPDGWHAAVLIPVVIVLGYTSFACNDLMEVWLFDGDMRVWITSELGISFDQRNALIVGIAMGMAVIPTIFSITEDAIFAVPKHLSYGSLALGATPWQTLVGVVLPTASPGIFSALMIGMGRAVGETMIVLMATGNTPIMDANIFEGMRTLAANIAVEVPEAEVDSTHYRVLFLAAFVLFLFTFVVNTAAELIRQRLRIKYGSL